MDWLKRMNSVLDYIEDNLDGEIKDDKIAMLSANSKGIFQKIFTVITDMTLSEYIRKRRLTQAAADIRRAEMKIIDAAVKYGYTSADAFSAAFKNFHGMSPSDAKKSNIRLQSFQRFTFTFNISVKGGYDNMQYRNISFEDIITLDRDFVMEVIRITQTTDWIIALKNASEELKEKIFSCISKTVADIIRAELQSTEVSLTMIEAVQQKIVAQIFELEEKGEIAAPRT
jgi:AraC family transcriptional regulator